MAGQEVKHDYHLVNPSPWPFLMSVAVMFLTVGAVFSMKPDSTLFGVQGASFANWMFFGGFIMVLYTMYTWWKDVVNEAESGDHTPVVQLHHRYGMILFIASEVMFFVAWFWAFFNFALYPHVEATTSLNNGDANYLWQIAGQEAPYFWDVFTNEAVWPPKGIETFDPWHLPFLNTVILLLSGTTVTWAHHALIEDDRKSLKQGLWLTVGLGALFTCVQAYEYGHAAFEFSGNVYSASFYMATGFHGFHVLVGTIFLIVCLARVYKGHFKPEHHFGFEAAAWYWHFVDVVWLFLFFAIYIWGA
ncbi:cytochrome c oxidase subunit 3 [Temperatibacter marinus]|uniref:Cytochrome c oxidase subunit 3 n=1 Tax=Temperatibacter marinus TaxID=1456591 RepID=A0AA52EIG7_9PROT|nr:cytochrome c oxidase subunit 3 [Temperatibacter marinus]WND02909.1 cytochrome c oxidase subunit 3 [Temperatibacter marinus]